MMLTPILGSESAERVLIYIACRDSGYASAIAKVFGVASQPLAKKMALMERDGLLIRENVGRTAVYRLNPRYSFTKDLRCLLLKAVDRYPSELKETLLFVRRRPRLTGKPL